MSVNMATTERCVTDGPKAAGGTGATGARARGFGSPLLACFCCQLCTVTACMPNPIPQPAIGKNGQKNPCPVKAHVPTSSVFVPP